MKKGIIFILIFSLIYFLFSSCKKYPDGPWLSFSSKYKRIEKVSWKLEYLEIGGIDSTVYFLAEHDSGYKFESMEFYHQAEGNSYISYISQKYSSASVYFDWGFTDNKKKLFIDITSIGNPYYSFEYHVGPFWVNEKIEFRIRKLTNDELWLETNYNDELVKAHFRNN